MGLFKKSRARVVRRGVGDQVIEERTTKTVGGSTVEVRRVREIVEPALKFSGKLACTAYPA